jgi:hypothetical protein
MMIHFSLFPSEGKSQSPAYNYLDDEVTSDERWQTKHMVAKQDTQATGMVALTTTKNPVQ